ncbi:MAG: hypothetical protein JO086_16505 [Acidimicrobiia bacterium]|nr:hypothetical protein [Acidimicrobiia bacterium]
MPTDAAVAARDAGLRRVKRLTRGAVAAGVALTGAFSVVAAHAFPGRSGQRATASPFPADAVAPRVAETTVLPTTAPPTTAAASVPTVAHRPLQPPVTSPRAVVPVRPSVAPVPTPVVRRVRPHAVSGAS